jgi:hypothetical protein
MTIEQCATICKEFQLFGLEYGRECYCGNALDASSELKALSYCNMPCSGDAQQRCGAGFRLSTYENLDYIAPKLPYLSGYTYQGCILDSVEQRVLPDHTIQFNNLTYATCASFCTGYQYFGVEYGSECYCGKSLSNNTSHRPEGECNMPCTGDSNATCGAAFRIGVFKSNATLILPANPIIPGYNYSGCYTDSVNERVLQKAFYFDELMTVEKCNEYCDGTKYFGTQYGGECYCGDEFAYDSSLVPESECSFLCRGDKAEFCGAANRLSLWTRLGNGTLST